MCVALYDYFGSAVSPAAIAQLGERQTEDLKVPGSIPGLGIVQHARIMPFTGLFNWPSTLLSLSSPVPSCRVPRGHMFVTRFAVEGDLLT